MEAAWDDDQSGSNAQLRFGFTVMSCEVLKITRRIFKASFVQYFMLYKE